MASDEKHAPALSVNIMNRLFLALMILNPTLTYASNWDFFGLSKQEVYVELKGNLVVVDDYISGTEAYLCKTGEQIKKGMVNCVDLVSESMSLLELKSTECVVVEGLFRKYSDEFVFMGSGAEVGLLIIDPAKNIRKC